MIVRSAVCTKSATPLSRVSMKFLVCFLVLLTLETNAQRAAIGIGSKLKQAFGSKTFGASRHGNNRNTSQGEEYDTNNANALFLSALRTTAKERQGIAATVLAMICGYIFFLINQISKIYEIEQAMTSGEFQVLARQLFERLFWTGKS